MGAVRVAIVGVGNCASALVQGVHYYRSAPDDGFIPGLMRPRLGPYHVGDIEFSAAFDIDARKVGTDLSEAILTAPNNTVSLRRGPRPRRARPPGHDPRRPRPLPLPGDHQSHRLHRRHRGHPARDPHRRGGELPARGQRDGDQVVRRADPRRRLRVRQLHPGLHRARELLAAPVRGARACPVVGDDVKSQVGATIVHRVLTRLFMDRGVRLDRTSQLNVGGNTDFYNMLERQRLESKKISKTDSVRSQLAHEMPDDSIHIGPERLRAVAGRPQVGPHPPGRARLRRSAHQRRAEARGVGLAQLGRRGHRRHPLLQDRHGPRPQGRARSPPPPIS